MTGSRVVSQDGQLRVGLCGAVAAGVALVLAATYLLTTGNVLAATGLIATAMFVVALVLDFSAGAIWLLALSVLVPNGVALYFGPAVPLLTFQRVMLVLLVTVALAHGPGVLIRAAWDAPGVRILWAMTLVMAVSTALSREPAVSQREFLSERVIGLPLYFAVVWLALPSASAAQRALRALGHVGFGVAVLAVAEAVTGQGVVAGLHLLPPQKLQELGYQAVLERRAGFPRVESVFQHPLVLGAFLVAYVPLAASLRQHARASWARAYWTASTVVSLAALVLTWSRGAWVALLVALLLLRGVGWRRWLLVSAGALAFLVVWSQLGFLQIGKVVYRWWLLSSVVSAMWGHYGFGSGPGTFVSSVVVRMAGTRMGITSADAMAYSLTSAIEAGPVFVALLWWLVLRTLGRARQARDVHAASGRMERAQLLDALRAGLLANLLLSIVSSSLFGSTVGSFIAFLLLVAVARLSTPEPAP